MKRTENVPTPSPEGEPKPCPECQGRGWTDNFCVNVERSHVCAHCNGRGMSPSGKECEACHGTGRIEVRKVDKTPCSLCNGAGVYPVPESMTISEFAYRPGLKK